jgi:hypothetical protein
MDPPVTGNLYAIDNLSPNTNYSYNVIALSNIGPSDRSGNVTVTTLALPTIIAGNAVCSGTTVSLSSLYSGYTTNWGKSSNLSIASPTPTSAVFSASTGGNSWISATIVSPGGQLLPLQTLYIWAGKPTISAAKPLLYYSPGVYNQVCNLQTFTTDMNVYGGSSVVWIRTSANPSNIPWSQNGNNISSYFYSVGQTEVFRISGSNACGTTSYSFGFKSIDCSGGGGGCEVEYTVSPNPASDEIVIVPNIPAPCDPIMQSAEFSGTVTLYDNQGVTKKKVNYEHYEQITLNTSDLKNGIHYLDIYDGKMLVKKTILIQK